MGKFLSISQNTFVQTIRQPIFGILILVTFAILALELCQAGWTMTSDYVVANQKLLQDLGLSTLLRQKTSADHGSRIGWRRPKATRSIKSIPAQVIIGEQKTNINSPSYVG